MNVKKIPCRKSISDKIQQLAEHFQEIVVVTSDARGSAMIGSFAEKFPNRFIEVGIAEQTAVGVAAGLALSGKKAFVFGPACFYSARSLEQVKNDVAYSNANVKIIGVSGGVSYGCLGSTHHALHDIAVMRAIPNLSVILPSDASESEKITELLLEYEQPTYVRVGRQPVPVFHRNELNDLKIGKALLLNEGNDATIIATGETVWYALEASKELKNEGIGVDVLEVHTIKPLDSEAILASIEKTGRVVTVEEHSIFGGLGSAVAELIAQEGIPARLRIIGIPDEYPVTGNQLQVFKHYGLDSEGIKNAIKNILTGK